MSQYPDFSQLGYQVNQELGRNRTGGRITHLADVLESEQKVVIKEFRFADVGADWSGFKAYEREIEVLRQLKHPRIPRYLDSLETPQGFCLIQEYKNAPSLAIEHKFTPEQVKQIAISVLEILVYLQQLNPPIFHRDIKPENVLVDEKCNAYLVDFGFARVDDGQIAMSSVTSGTPGFIPPETYYGRNLTEASDLYSLGVTLICLLTNTRSVNINHLIDDNHRFYLRDVATNLTPQFINWLEKMVEPSPKKRFANAEVALMALNAISAVKKTQLSHFGSNQITFPHGMGIVALFSLFLVGLQSIEEMSTAEKLQQQQIYSEQQVQSERQENQINQLLEKQEQLEYKLDQIIRLQRQQDRKLREQQRQQEKKERLLEKQRQQASLLERLSKTKECNNCNLQQANFQDIKLENISLEGANLSQVNLENANLQRSNLSKINFQNANLESSNLANVNLANANLSSAKLTGANLQNANLSNAQLKYASLNYADLRGADLRGVNLSSSQLNGADLRGANLRYTNLDNVNMGNVKLTGAIMPDGTKAN